MDQPIIVDAHEVLRLGRFRKVWLLGWLVATVALIAVAVQTVRIEERDLVMEELRAVQAEQLDIQEQQKQVTASFTKAWEQQQETAKLLTVWGQFVVEKTEMINKNRAYPPLNVARKQ